MLSAKKKIKILIGLYFPKINIFSFNDANFISYTII